MYFLFNEIGIFLKLAVQLKWIIFFSFLLSNNGVLGEFDKLPNCQESVSKGLVLVSTLDGRLSALSSDANLLWQIDTGPGPLLTSNIHNLELTNNGQWIRIIPSLSGTLYKFDGQTVDQIPLSADTLLKSSFRYSDDLVIAGGLEVRKYGVALRKGTIYYTCSLTQCVNATNGDDEPDDILIIERSTQTVRAIEPRTGNERWTFSVGMHDIKLAEIGCTGAKNKEQIFNSNISTVLPDGILRISHKEKEKELLYEYKFSAPIVHIWKWDGNALKEVDLFATNHFMMDPSINLSPAIYIGMHMKQLYIREFQLMQTLLEVNHFKDTGVVESNSLYKIPWKPIPASTIEADDDSTALSVLYASEYMNGNGYYLYTDNDLAKDMSPNNSIENQIEIPDPLNPIEMFILMWRELIMITGFTVSFIYIIHTIFKSQKTLADRVEVPSEKNQTTPLIECSPSPLFSSRYINDFDTLRCLGKGGFGVVFEVKQKIDECSYAIKRITLPSGEKSRSRVLREVKALAKLDHQNIVRYFNAWVENPPSGWQDDYDKHWVKNDEETTEPSEKSINETSTRRTQSVSISIRLPEEEEDYDFSTNTATNRDDSIEIVFENEGEVAGDDTSGIVFEKEIEDDENSNEIKLADKNSTSSVTKNSASSVTKDTQSAITEHLKKKSFWRRPRRQHHSWDISHSMNKLKNTKISSTFLYIQMQLCQKESLREWLKTNHDRKFDDILNIFKQILSAVDYVHLQGLIHRDLKPSNIFFSLEGQIKVGDFGLVKDMEESLDMVVDRSLKLFPNHTKNVGTYLYMSPEQLKSGKYNHKVDIYSLGLIFFELLVPFSTDMERVTVLTNLRNNKYPPKFADDYPQEYQLLKMMLCRQPEQRLTTIGIKAKPPLNCPDNRYGEEYFFKLPK